MTMIADLVAAADVEGLEQVLAGLDPDLREAALATALAEAARAGLDAVCDALLRLGADPAATDDQDRTPADLADKAGHRALAQRLRLAWAVTR